VTPWAGDTNRVIHDLLGKTRESEQGTALNLSSMEAIRERYEHLRTSILLCPTRENEEITQDISVLVSHWHDVADGHANVGISGKFQRLASWRLLCRFKLILTSVSSNSCHYHSQRNRSGKAYSNRTFGHAKALPTSALLLSCHSSFPKHCPPSLLSIAPPY